MWGGVSCLLFEIMWCITSDWFKILIRWFILEIQDGTSVEQRRTLFKQPTPVIEIPELIRHSFFYIAPNKSSIFCIQFLNCLKCNLCTQWTPYTPPYKVGYRFHCMITFSLVPFLLSESRQKGSELSGR